MKTKEEKTISVRFKPSKHEVDFNGESAFNSMQAACHQAFDTRGDKLFETNYTFAGNTACIKSAGSNIAEYINQAYAHLRNDSSPKHSAGLNIDLWDEHETGVPCPVESVDSLLRAATEYGFVIGSSRDRFIGCQSANMTSWYDRLSARIISCVSKSQLLSVHERGKPLHFPLLVWHTDHGVPVIHAGLVSYNGHGVLLAGKGGTGKSTIALSCLDAGFRYLGDDYVALEALGEGSFQGHSLYNTAWLEREHMSRFPLFLTHAIHGEAKKLPILLSRAAPEKLARVCPIRLLLLPRVKEQLAAPILPATKTEALLALTPTSMFRLPVSGRPAFDRICQLVDRVPCYWIELDRDLKTIPRRVKQLLEELVT